MQDTLQKDEKGFTLIEIIVTIVFLALVSLPLLMYFTDSVRHSSRTKQEQNAVVVAQDTLEELKNADYNLDTPAGATTASALYPSSEPWKVLGAEPAPDATAEGGLPIYNSGYDLWRKAKTNGTAYKVKAHIQPIHEVTNSLSGSPTTESYKEIDTSAIAMDSTKDVISKETSTHITNAKGYFFGLHAASGSIDPVVTADYIADRLVRTIQICLEPDASEADHILTTVRYIYKYKPKSGESYPAGIDDESVSGTNNFYPVNIEKSSIDKSIMRSVFVFYNPSGNSTGDFVEFVQGSYDETTNTYTENSSDYGLANELNLFFIAQNSVAYASNIADRGLDASVQVRDSAYKLHINKKHGSKIDGSGASDGIFGKVFTNLVCKAGAWDNTNMKYSGTHDEIENVSIFSDAACFIKNNGDYTLITTKETNRLAEIKVTVYADDGTANISGTEKKYTSVDGTRVQNNMGK